MAAKDDSPVGLDKIKGLGSDLVKNLGDKAIDTLNDKVGDLTGKITDLGDGAGIGGQTAAKAGEAAMKGDNPVIGGLKGAASGIKDKITKRKGGGGNKRPTNIYETYVVGVPVRVAYNEWTNYPRFPGYMKGPTKASREDEDGLETSWQAKIFLNNRGWKSKTVEQVPDQRIKWTTEGPKGSIDGCITFHEVADRLTQMVFILEYRPKGFFEWWGNRWRTVGRRSRLDMKHFVRDLMMRGEEADPDGALRSTIEDGEVTETDADAREREEQEEQDRADQEAADEGSEEYEEEPGDEAEGEYEEEPGDEAEGEYEEEPEDEYEGEPEEEEEPEAEEAPEDEAGAEEEPEEEAEAEPEAEDEVEEAPEDEDEAAAEPEPEPEEEEEPEEEAPKRPARKRAPRKQSR
jgi:Polyketide cyclase / dehydrase and lipid transport